MPAVALVTLSHFSARLIARLFQHFEPYLLLFTASVAFCCTAYSLRNSFDDRSPFLICGCGTLLLVVALSDAARPQQRRIILFFSAFGLLVVGLLMVS